MDLNKTDLNRGFHPNPLALSRTHIGTRAAIRTASSAYGTALAKLFLKTVGNHKGVSLDAARLATFEVVSELRIGSRPEDES